MTFEEVISMREDSQHLSYKSESDVSIGEYINIYTSRSTWRFVDVEETTVLDDTESQKVYLQQARCWKVFVKFPPSTT